MAIQTQRSSSFIEDPRFAQAVQNYETGLKAMQERKFEKAKGLLTVLEPASAELEESKRTRREAFLELSRSLNLDDAKAQAWMDLIREARR